MKGFMSSTIIKSLWPGEKHEDLMNLRNSWGSAPVVWDFMTKRYIGPNAVWLMTATAGDLWKLTERQDIPQHHRNMLRMTYDNVVVYKKDYAKAASDIRAWLADLIGYDGVNHWDTIAALFESNPDIPAIGFHWTTVNCDPWNGEWNEEAEDYGPTDWASRWDMYGEQEEVTA
jgi:hypothetical protein